MSGDVVARARELLDGTEDAPLTIHLASADEIIGALTGLVAEVEKLRAENARWLQVAELLDAASPTQAETEIACLGLSIHLGPWGEWGRETLEALFRDFGIQPGDDYPAASNRQGDLLREVDKLRGAIETIRELHRPVAIDRSENVLRCRECRNDWPCDTAWKLDDLDVIERAGIEP